MRKRGRHGKRADNAEPAAGPSNSTAQAHAGSPDNAAAMAAAAAWSLASPALQPNTAALAAQADPAAFSLLDTLPRFFSLPPDISIASTQQQQPAPAPAPAAPMETMISAMAQPFPAARAGPHPMASTMGMQGPNQSILASVLSPTMDPVQVSPAAITSAFLGSIDTQPAQPGAYAHYLPQHYRSRAPSSFLSSPSPNPSTFSQQQQQQQQHAQPPMFFRSMSTGNGGHVFDTSVAMTTSLSNIASPIGLGSVLGSPALTMPFSPQQQQQHHYQQQNTSATAAAAAAAAAVAAF
ncbi:hypothetical protein IWW50_006002, partial [Coemansia erecta]